MHYADVNNTCTFTIKGMGYRWLCKLKAHNEFHFVVPQNSIMVSTLQTFNVIDIQCCRHSMLQPLRAFDVANVWCCKFAIRCWILQTLVCSIQNILYCQTEQPRARSYVYAYSNDIHNVATKDLLTQQLFSVLLFLIKFKTLSLIIEPSLAAKLCAN